MQYITFTHKDKLIEVEFEFTPKESDNPHLVNSDWELADYIDIERVEIYDEHMCLVDEEGIISDDEIKRQIEREIMLTDDTSF